EAGDAVQQLGLDGADYPQRLQVARPRGLQVHEPVCCRGGDRVGGELVGAGVQAQLVWPELARDGRVPDEVAGEQAEVAKVLDALLEIADEARRQRHPLDPEALELSGEVEVLGQRRGRRRLVDGNLDLSGVGGGPPQVICHARYVGDGPTVLDGRAL